MTSTNNIISTHDGARVEENPVTGQRLLRATKPFKKDEVISLFAAGQEFSSPTYLTLQKDDDVHITLSPLFLQYVNHSCSPNSFFDTATMQFVALTNINEGDEFTFFYPSTEWQMAQPFQCYCGAENCLGAIQGAAFIPKEILAQYRLTDFILRKLSEPGVMGKVG